MPEALNPTLRWPLLPAPTVPSTAIGYDRQRADRAELLTFPDPTPVDPGADASAGSGPAQPASSPEATAELLVKARGGDRDSVDALVSRCLPPLRRWARGRLPRYARDLLETDDLVQETVVNALKRLDTFEARREGALQAYLRQAIVNRIRDEIRRVGRKPLHVELADDQADAQTSPLEVIIGEQLLARYEVALAALRPEEREAIVARIELQYSYEQVAEALGKPSQDAARMAVARALVRLAEVMGHEI